MNLFIKIIIVVLAFFVASYYLYFYISPSVTVINKSALETTKVNVTLPNSNLNFGSIESDQKNTLYYSLSQKTGTYSYSIHLADKELTGTCGYITSNEINKRVVIIFDKNKEVNCSQ